jgi:hypothetical protein
MHCMSSGASDRPSHPPPICLAHTMPILRSGMPCGQLKLISKASTPTASQRSMISSHASLQGGAGGRGQDETAGGQRQMGGQVVMRAAIEISQQEIHLAQHPWSNSGSLERLV